MPDLSHLSSLELRLSHERARLEAAKTAGERRQRAVWVAQLEREIADEIAFIGRRDTDLPEMTDADLLAELGA